MVVCTKQIVPRIYKEVLRIQLILMRIRILYLHWKTIDQDPNPDNFSFFNSSDLGFESKKLFFALFWFFCLLDPDPWIRIFLRIRIQEPKILRIQRIWIRILSTDTRWTAFTQQHTTSCSQYHTYPGFSSQLLYITTYHFMFTISYLSRVFKSNTLHNNIPLHVHNIIPIQCFQVNYFT